MRIYDYDKYTGEIASYDGREAREDPLEPGRFLIPKFATDIRPPKPHRGTTAVFKDSRWSEVADHRGKTYYSKETGEAVVITELGDEAVHELTHLLKPEEGEWKWSKKKNNWVEDVKANKARRISESKAYLERTDWYVIRKIETGKEIPEDILKAREEARKKIV